MSEEKIMEKTPAVRPEAAPGVKETAKPPMEKEAAKPPVPKEEAGLPAEKEAAGLPAEKAEASVPAAPSEEPEEVHVDSPEPDMEINIIDDRDKEAEGLIRWDGDELVLDEGSQPYARTIAARFDRFRGTIAPANTAAIAR